jgi:glycine dehydrogenase subunit 1
MSFPNSTHPYIPNSDPETKKSMLDFLGVKTVDDLYSAIPSALRVEGTLQLPSAFKDEQSLAKHVISILKKNTPQSSRVSFLGAGTYNHYVPAVVDEVINRSEFLTAYAGDPYEDHGRFQALFEYESLMAELVNMDVVNVPTYDGMQAAATSLAMAQRITRRKKILVVTEINPDKFSKVSNYNQTRLEFVNIPTKDMQPDTNAIKNELNSEVAAIWLDTPNYFGTLCANIEQLAKMAHQNGSLLVVGVDPISLGVLQSPAECGADIINGDIQSLGIHSWFGGGHGGFIAVNDDPKFVMELPSRLFGLESTAVPGEYGFGDVAYERTSFALREEGKEWVGTAAALWGIAAAVFLSLMGPRGMVDIGETIIARTRYAMQKLGEISGLNVLNSPLQFREFVIDLTLSGKSALDVINQCRSRNIEPGVRISDSKILVCVTEMNSETDINNLHDALIEIIGGRK